MSSAPGSLLTGRQWQIAFGISTGAAVLLYPFYSFISPWLGCSIFLTTLVLLHLHYSSRYVVAFPHVAFLISALQYVFAAWFGLYHQHENPVYFIGYRLPDYYAYVGPVLLALVIGFAASLVRLRLPVHGSSQGFSNPALLKELDLMGLLGFGCLVLSNLISIGGVTFLLLLLGNLRFVSVYGRMIVKGEGWRWRLALVLILEVLFATASAMFHSMLLWLLWTFVLWVHCFRPKIWTTFATLAIAVLLLPGLQQAKWLLRTETLDPVEGIAVEITDPSVLDRTMKWLLYLGPSLRDTIMLQLDEEFLADMAVRYNQGWIINRVMQFTPNSQPFARGETLVSAVEASVLPRLIAENKAQSGGRENMERFAGLVLSEGTSMNLGYAGEMYANFGETGGIIGCGFYALFFGLVFRFICKRGFQHPLWWSFVPFVFYGAVKAEDDIAFALNWAVKGLIVLGGVILFLPHLRQALFSDSSRPVTSPLQGATITPSGSR